MDGSAAMVMAVPAREALRDGRGNILGVLERQRLVGKVLLRDAWGALLGSYDARSDVRRDASSRLVGQGYLLPMLLSR